MTITFDQAKEILNSAIRWELRDHAFGDTEFGWKNSEGKEIAGGYSGGGRCDVWIEDSDISFKDDEARELKKCGRLGAVERNDETGPDTYVEGQVMPGLSKGDVFHELTGQYLDES